jgi:hypothetical protein
VLVISLCLASLGGVPGAAALFVDTNSVPAGTAQAGTLDLKLSEIGPATRASTTDERHRDAIRDTFEDANHDGTPIRNTLRIENTRSSLTADRIGLTVSYTESDGSGGQKGNAKNTARTIRLTRFTYKGANLLSGTIRDENANGRLDIDDLTLGQTKQNLAALSGIQAGSTADVIIEFRGDRTSGSNIKKRDGIDLTLQATGSANSFTDRDVSTSNLIRYTGTTANFVGGVDEIDGSSALVYFEGANGKTWYYANAYYKINGQGDGGGGYKFLDLVDPNPSDTERRYEASLTGLSPGDTIEYYFEYARGNTETYTYTFAGGSISNTDSGSISAQSSSINTSTITTTDDESRSIGNQT